MLPEIPLLAEAQFPEAPLHLPAFCLQVYDRENRQVCRDRDVHGVVDRGFRFRRLVVQADLQVFHHLLLPVFCLLVLVHEDDSDHGGRVEEGMVYPLGQLEVQECLPDFLLQ